MLKLSRIAKAYNASPVLSCVDLTVAAGECVVLLGGNGTGKTTLLDVVSGLLRRDAGEIWIGDTPVQSLNPWEVSALGVSRMFQAPRLFPGLTALENVMVVLKPLQSIRGWRHPLAWRTESFWLQLARDRALYALDLVGIPGRAGQVAGTMSYGEQRLIEVARVVAREPLVSLMDEPIAGLHPEIRVNLLDTIYWLAMSGRAVLVTGQRRSDFTGMDASYYELAKGVVRRV